MFAVSSVDVHVVHVLGGKSCGGILSAAINLVPNVFVLSAPVRLGINGDCC
ncbi:MAG: hypothetical protein ACK4QL_10055 [Pseudanabaenaceae cyanobacterium]